MIINKKVILPSLALCSFISFLYILPLVIANVYYVDDMARSVYGYAWGNDGRTISTAIMSILSGGSLILNLSPYTNILSAVFLSFSGLALCITLRLCTVSNVHPASFLILTSPFMLENLTYKYDSLPMSLSIMASVIPFLFYHKKQFPIIAGFGIFVTLFTYQASIIIFPMIFSFLLVIDVLSGRKISLIGTFLKITSSFLITAALSLICNFFFPPAYSGRNRLIIDSESPVEELTKNAWKALELTVSALSSTSAAIVFIIVFIVLLASISIILIRSREKVKALAAVILFSLAAISYPAINVLLLNPWWTSRVMVGFPIAIIAFLAVINLTHTRASRLFGIISCLISFPMMASYANALKSQDEFSKDIVRDIFAHVSVGERAVAVNGAMPLSDEVKISISNYPLFKRIIIPYVNNGWSWGGHFISKMGYIDRSQYLQGKGRDAILQQSCSMHVSYKAFRYTVRESHNSLLIDFDKSECQQ